VAPSRYLFPTRPPVSCASCAQALPSQGGAPRRVVLGRPLLLRRDDPDADMRGAAAARLRRCRRRLHDIAFQSERSRQRWIYEAGVAPKSSPSSSDIGGASLDFSVCECRPTRLAATASGHPSWGGIHIGGTDFDRLV